MSWPWRKKSDLVDPSSEFEDLETRLLAYFRKKVSNEDDAQDLAQETMIVVTRAFDQGVTSKYSSLDHYAFVVAFNVQADYYRRTYRRLYTISLDDLQQDPPSSQFGKEMAATENFHYTQRLLSIIKEILSGDAGKVMALIYQGETPEGIAKSLGIPAPTVRSHLLRGRGRLLEYLVKNEPDILGGIETIKAAWEATLSDSLPPTEAEIAAWYKHKPVEIFRSACLKMARHLPSPLD